MTQQHKVLIVDDHVLFRQGLIGLLNSQPDFCVVGEAGTLKEAFRLANDLHPDLILMDFSLPDGSGADVTKLVLKILPDTNIVFLTMHDEDEFLLDAIRSGAKGYLLKNMSVDKLFSSLRGLERGEAALSRQMTTCLIKELGREGHTREQSDPVFDKLTRRESDIINEVVKGKSNEDIAKQLFISVSTVKNHISNIFEKLGLKNRYELAAYAEHHNFRDLKKRPGGLPKD